MSAKTEVSKEASAPQQPEFLHRYKLDIRCELSAAWILLLVLLVVRFNAFRSLNLGYLGGIRGDAGLYVWLFKSHIRDLFTLNWFETHAFYPYSQSLAWSDNFILPGIIGKVLHAAGLSEPLAYNIIILTNSYLAGFFTYRLVFRLTGNLLAALCAAISFMTFPFLSGMLGHPQLQFTCVIPLGVSALIWFAATRSILPAILFGISISLAFTTAVYFSVFLPIAAATLYLGLSLLRPRWLSVRQHLTFILGACLGVLPTIFFVPPYLDIVRTFGERQIYEAFYFAATALSFIASPPGTLFYGATSSFSHAEALLFPGFVTFLAIFPAFLRLCEAKPLSKIAYLFAACFGLCFVLSVLCTMVEGPSEVTLRYATAAMSWASLGLFLLLALRMGVLERKLGFLIVTNRALIVIFLLLALMTFFIALGPLGNPEQGQYAVGIHRLWYAILPGLDSVRAISRIGVLTAFALSVVLGLVISHFIGAFRTFAKCAVLLPAVIVLENFYTVIPIESETRASTVYELLASKPHADDAVIVLPWAQQLNEKGQPDSWGEFARRNIDYMMRIFPTSWRLVNGYSGQRSKMMREFPQQLGNFPDKRSVDTICGIAGVRYLIYSSKDVPGFNQNTFMGKADGFSQQIQYVDADGEGNYLFELPCLSKLTNGFELLVPSYPQGELHIDVAAPGLAPEVISKILVTTPVGDQDIPVATMQFPGGAEWQSMIIPVPKTTERVRPLRFIFRVPPDRNILIKSSKYQVVESRSWISRVLRP